MKLKISTSIYPVRAILNACYSFIDKFYFFLDTDRRCEKIIISIKPKKNTKHLKSLIGKFKNELIYAALRQEISSSNKKIREYIVGSALYSSELLTAAEKLSYKDDPLGIAKPWKEQRSRKNGKTKI